MFKSLRQFFAFCDPENRRCFYLSMIVGVIEAFFVSLKIPAIGLCVMDMLAGQIGPRTIWGSLGIMLLSIIGQAVCRYFSTMDQCRGGYLTCARKRIDIAEYMRYMPMGYFNANSLGQIASVATNTMQNLENVATMAVMLISKNLLTTAMIILMILFFDWRIGLLCIVGLGLFALINLALQRASARIAAAKIDSDTRQVEKVLEYVQGIAEVKTYRLVGRMAKQVNSAIDENVDINTRMEMSLIPWITLQSFMADLIGVGVAVLALFLWRAGSMSLLNTLMMQVCAFLINSSLKSAGAFSSLLRVVDVSVQKAQEILNSPTMDIDGEDIVPKDLSLTAENIRFAYKDRPVIDGVSLTIPAKSTTAIVGPSGGGKSTLCNLLARFWDVDEGSVKLGGRDLRDYDMDSLMRNFSFVFQRVTLFKDTVANNIRFGQPEASMDEVIAAAKRARCHDFIMALPEGYDTVISEDGGNFSGGERQRLSIARAMMKDAPIIILDEATSNIDPENEKELMEAIDELTREKTVIMIAHRLKTVRSADQILVIDHGRIVQRGRHEELMQQDGLYRRFIAERERAVSWKLENSEA